MNAAGDATPNTTVSCCDHAAHAEEEIKLSVGRHRITLSNTEFGINETISVEIKADAPEKLIKDYSTAELTEPAAQGRAGQAGPHSYAGVRRRCDLPCASCHDRRTSAMTSASGALLIGASPRRQMRGDPRGRRWPLPCIVVPA